MDQTKLDTIQRTDIKDFDDIVLLVDTFYEKVNQDDLLSPVFNDFAGVHWDTHLPNMYSFWGSILLGIMQYNGQPFPRHLNLPITHQHFTRWLKLFYETVDELFEGDTAQDAKDRARSIAYIFQKRLGLLPLY